jgi:hypothetical protein
MMAFAILIGGLTIYWLVVESQVAHGWQNFLIADFYNFSLSLFDCQSCAFSGGGKINMLSP